MNSSSFYAQDYFVFVNALEGTLVLRKSLDYETLTNFSVDIRAQVSSILYTNSIFQKYILTNISYQILSLFYKSDTLHCKKLLRKSFF